MKETKLPFSIPDSEWTDDNQEICRNNNNTNNDNSNNNDKNSCNWVNII